MFDTPEGFLNHDQTAIEEDTQLARQLKRSAPHLLGDHDFRLLEVARASTHYSDTVVGPFSVDSLYGNGPAMEGTDREFEGGRQ